MPTSWRFLRTILQPGVKRYRISDHVLLEPTMLFKDHNEGIDLIRLTFRFLIIRPHSLLPAEVEWYRHGDFIIACFEKDG